MNKYRAIILIFICHAVGVALGVGVTYWYFSSVADKFVSSSAAAGASTKVAVLHRLRGGNTNSAIDVLETLLDGDLIGLQAVLSSTPAAQRDPSYVKTLQRARDYRTKFPHSSEHPEVDAAISNAFRLADEHGRK